MGRPALSRRIDWPVVLGLAVLVLLMRGAAFGNPVSDFDDQLYSFIGWRMLHGELPFVDWFDRKPFGLFALFAIAHAIGGPSAMAYQALAMLFTLGGALLTCHLARPLADRTGAAIAGAFYVVLMVAYGGPSGQSEAFFVPMMLVALALVRDWHRPDAPRRALASMALCGLALQIKYTVLPQCLFLGLWVLYGQWRTGASLALLIRRALIYAALGLAPTALVGLFYLAIGGWDAFWFANITSSFARAGGHESRFHPSLLLWTVPLLLPLLGALYYSLRVAPPRDGPRYLYFALWSLSVLATVLLPKTIYPYYFAALAPCIALLATPFYARASLIGLGPPLLLLAFTINMLNLPARYPREAAERRDIAAFAAAIAPHVDAQENCLFVFDGPTALYRLTGGCVPSRIVYPDHFNNALETDAIGVSQVGEIARILANHPGVIVTASSSVTPQNPDALELITLTANRDYQPIAHVLVSSRVITAWARQDDPLLGRQTSGLPPGSQAIAAPAMFSDN